MYRISELADLVGLSRSTLLYYGKLGLIEAQRTSNGYRSYSERDLQRVKLLQQLQAGGLTLKECQACLDAKVDRSLLQNRLEQLDEEIAQKQRSRDLLSALLGESGLQDWHESMDKVAPDAHLDLLLQRLIIGKPAFIAHRKVTQNLVTRCLRMLDTLSDRRHVWVLFLPERFARFVRLFGIPHQIIDDQYALITE